MFKLFSSPRGPDGESLLELRLLSKPGCGLCEEMKEQLALVTRGLNVRIEEVDISERDELVERHGEEIPVLFVNGSKAFKVRASTKDLRRRLERELG